jgi:hypothetical protein
LQVHCWLQFGTQQNVDCHAWLPKPFEVLWLQVGLATMSAAFWQRKFVEFSWSPGLWESVSLLWLLYSSCTVHPFPVNLGECECRPHYMFRDPAIGSDCCDRAILMVCTCNK